MLEREGRRGGGGSQFAFKIPDAQAKSEIRDGLGGRKGNIKRTTRRVMESHRVSALGCKKKAEIKKLALRIENVSVATCEGLADSRNKKGRHWGRRELTSLNWT